MAVCCADFGMILAVLAVGFWFDVLSRITQAVDTVSLPLPFLCNNPPSLKYFPCEAGNNLYISATCRPFCIACCESILDKLVSASSSPLPISGYQTLQCFHSSIDHGS